MAKQISVKWIVVPHYLLLWVRDVLLWGFNDCSLCGHTERVTIWWMRGTDECSADCPRILGPVATDRTARPSLPQMWVLFWAGKRASPPRTRGDKGNGRTHDPDGFLISGLWGFFLPRPLAKSSLRNVFTVQLTPNLLGGVGVIFKVLSLIHITFLFCSNNSTHNFWVTIILV